MVGFVSAVLGEVLTGRGPLSQVGLYTGQSPATIALVAVGLIGFNYLAAINPRSPTWSPENQLDVYKRVKSPPSFPRQLEVYVGRFAMFGFLMTVINEVQTGGRGPLGQLGIRVIANPQTAANALFVWVGFAIFTAVSLSILRFRDDPEY
jgi:photosystem II protein